MKSLRVVIVLLCAVLGLQCAAALRPHRAVAATVPVAQIITAVNFSRATDNTLNTQVIFSRTYGTNRVYRVFYSTTNSSDIADWKYAQFTVTPLADTVSVSGLADAQDYYFKARVYTAMGAMLAESDTWHINTTDATSDVTKSYNTVLTSTDSPVTINAAFSNDSSTSTIPITIPAGETDAVKTVTVTSHLVDGDSQLTFDVRDADNNAVTSLTDPVTMVIPYDAGKTADNQALSYTHLGSTFQVPLAPTDGTPTALLAAKGAYWKANTDSTFVFTTQKFSELDVKKAPASPVPASSSASLVVFIVLVTLLTIRFARSGSPRRLNPR